MNKLTNTIPKAEYDTGDIKEILVVGSIGIGNLILFSAAMKLLRERFKNARITVVVLRKIFTIIYDNDPNIDRVILLDSDKIKSAGQKIAFIKELRKTKYQICITTFPANRLEYNILAWLSGAAIRIAHLYDSKRFSSFSFLQNIRVPIDKSIHDLDQNLNLVHALGVESEGKDRKMYLEVGKNAGAEAGLYLERNGLTGSVLIGMHPGSSYDRGMNLKRWPTTYFARLCDWLSEEYNVKVLLMGGNEEIALREEITAETSSSPHIVKDLDFPTTVSLIEKCRFFITNDSGLMHIAAAKGVGTAAFFGPTDQGRTAPFGDNNKVIRLGLDCSPCWSIKNLGVGWVNCIHPENICMVQMTLEYVKEELTPFIKGLKNV